MLASFLTQAKSMAMLMDRGFRNAVLEGNGTLPIFIMFTSWNDNRCRQIQAQFDKAAEEGGNMAKFAFVAQSMAPDLCKELGVKTVPSYYLYMNNQSYQYEGAPIAEGFLQFASMMINEAMAPVNETWATNENNRTIMFTKRTLAPDLITALYGALHVRGIDVGYVDPDSEVGKAFGDVPLNSIWFYRTIIDSETNQTIQEKKMYDGIRNCRNVTRAAADYFSYDMKAPTDVNA